VSTTAPGGKATFIIADFVLRLTDGHGNIVSRTFDEPINIEFTILVEQVPDNAKSETLLVAFCDGAEWQIVDGTAVINEDRFATVVVGSPTSPSSASSSRRRAASVIPLPRAVSPSPAGVAGSGRSS